VGSYATAAAQIKRDGGSILNNRFKGSKSSSDAIKSHVEYPNTCDLFNRLKWPPLKPVSFLLVFSLVIGLWLLVCSTPVECSLIVRNAFAMRSHSLSSLLLSSLIFSYLIFSYLICRLIAFGCVRLRFVVQLHTGCNHAKATRQARVKVRVRIQGVIGVPAMKEYEVIDQPPLVDGANTMQAPCKHSAITVQ